jgi:hypothetical protein
VHARGERQLLGFMHGEEALVKGLDHRIAPGGYQCAHVQRSSHSRPAAPDRAVSALLATVLIEWRQSDEGGDLLVRDAAKLGEVG